MFSGVVVKIKYLGGLARIAGKSSEMIFVEQKTLKALLFKLKNLYGEKFNQLLQQDADGNWQCLLVLNQRLLTPDEQHVALQDNDEIAFIPPVYGG